MLVFIDESGDTGLRIEAGASPYFTVALVLFEDEADAVACDQRIQLLKRELNLSPNFEFHFYHNSKRLREKFLEAVAPYTFFYVAVAIHKDPARLVGPIFQHKEAFYHYVCGLVFENAKPYLRNAKVKVDKSGRALFRTELSKYLKKRMNINDAMLIKSVKMEPSHSNNLLQLCDYVAGIVNRKVQGKGVDQYYRHIASKELNLQILPK